VLTFELYTDAPREPACRIHVHLDPLAVASVREAERRPAVAGPRRVAVLTLSGGQELTVCDPAGTAAAVVRQAREEARGRDEREGGADGLTREGG
jgi:hypothetical protein